MQVLLLMLLGFAADPAPDEAIRKLQTERLKTAKEAMKEAEAFHDMGRGTLESVFAFASLVRDAELDLATKPAERLAAHEKFLKRAVEMHVLAAVKLEVGRITPSDLQLAKATRLKAEIDLRKAGGIPPKRLAWPAMPKDVEKD